MFEISANIEYMFTDAGASLEQRIEAAAHAGIGKVEMFAIDNRDPQSLAAALKDHDVVMWTVLNDPRTILADRSNHKQFVENFKRTSDFAAEIGCPNVVCGSGTGLPFIPRAASLDAAAEAIASVVKIAEEHDQTVLLEAVNARVDHPGVLFSATSDAWSVAQQVDSPRVKILYDLYHSVAEGESPTEVLPQIIERVGHLQIADYPGRGEPGSGEILWPEMLSLLQRVGYRGAIGVECHPRAAATISALEYIRILCR
jgi:hydroxypyruvate isomerase